VFIVVKQWSACKSWFEWARNINEKRELITFFYC